MEGRNSRPRRRCPDTRHGWASTAAAWVARRTTCATGNRGGGGPPYPPPHPFATVSRQRQLRAPIVHNTSVHHAGEFGQMMWRDARGALNVQHTISAHHQLIGDEPAVAAPVKRFGTHEGRA